jgi:hypothetical protein
MKSFKEYLENRVPPPLPAPPKTMFSSMGGKEAGEYMDRLWQDSTSEFKRKALGNTLPPDEPVPARYYLLSPEQRKSVSRFWGA